MIVYEIRAAVRTDPETAELLRETVQAAGVAITTPELVTDKQWILLVAAEALARASIEKRRVAA